MGAYTRGLRRRLCFSRLGARPCQGIYNAWGHFWKQGKFLHSRQFMFDRRNTDPGHRTNQISTSISIYSMKIAIVGVGLIGGSLALSLKKAKLATHIIGVDNNEEHIAQALNMGIIDSATTLKDALGSTDLIVLAVPVTAIQSLLPSILDQISASRTGTDLGFTKKAMLLSVANHPMRGRLVASHPMAGTEYSGPEAAVEDLYKGKNMVFCDITQTADDAFEVAENICEALGMNPVFMHAHEHDLHTAYVSHISHITSFALALTVLEKEKSQGRIFELASGGFASTVRLANSSADRWLPILRQHR